MLKSTCVPVQKHLEDFKKHPRVYWEFEDLIEQYKEKYGQDTPYDKIDLYDFCVKTHRTAKLRHMSLRGFFGAYALYVKIKEAE